MSTNYYLYDVSEECPHCGRGVKELHIGKSSYGWCFALHVIPEIGINNLNDWIEQFEKENTYIVNEYHSRISVKEMRYEIALRHFKIPFEDRLLLPNEETFHKINQSMRGPNNLLRHAINDRCIGHGEGTYDYIIGEFS